jgi:two-component system sensor histidine kinase BarA
MVALGVSKLILPIKSLIKWSVSGWSLQRKGLVFLGVALLIPIGLAFWFLSQIVARDLVRETTRQSARDHARSIVAWRHVESPNFGQQASQRSPGSPSPTFFQPEVYSILRTQLVDNPYFQHQFLMLDKEVAHDNLGSAALPNSDSELKLMERLEARYRQRLNSAISSAAPVEDGPNPLASGESASPLEYFTIPGMENLYEESGPVTDEDSAPDGGWYVYYHVIQFPDKCIMCHPRDVRYATEEVPFRVVKVKIPYRQTQVVSATTVALMIAVAMLTITCAFLFVHWVFRNIVLNPLQHLQSVSDEISRGNIYLRASLDTGDEFSDLGEAFNRMLRHLTESQSKLRELNMELDVRVDQLAQANLHLYEANRLKNDFMANMTHELRTPLNSILGFSDVLQGIESLNEKQRRYVVNIQNSGRALLEMINDILDLAKMEAGKMNVTATSFLLPDLVRVQCDALHSLLDEKNMDLQIEIDNALPPVFQDQAKIQQILTNLLSNAIKFTPDGGVITVQAGLESDNKFFLSVSDTGVGIPESDFEVIFQKFRQSSLVMQHDGLTRQYSGTGLGLSIVRELCGLLGGEIHLVSQLGTGSTFRVTLPVDYSTVFHPTTAVT